MSIFGKPVGFYQPMTVDQKRGGASGTKAGCFVILLLLPVVPAGEKAILPPKKKTGRIPPIKSIPAYKTVFAIY